MALALITTTFAGISSADGDDDGMLIEWTWDSIEGELTIIPTENLNTTNFSYDVSIGSSIDGTQQFYAEDTDVGAVTVYTNLTDGYYWVEISVWNDEGSWYDGGPICMGMDCSDAQVDVTYDEIAMVATLHIADAGENDSITAWLYNEWDGTEVEFTNLSDGYSIDMSTFGDGLFCLEIVASTDDGFDIDYQEICFQIGEEPVWPSMDINYDEVMSLLAFDLYDLPENSTFTYEAVIVSDESGLETLSNGTLDSNTTTIEFDIDLILTSTGQSDGVYWAYMDIWDAAGDHVIGDGTGFCYGDPTECEEEEEMFVCDNGNEIPMDWVNDGMDDCGDNSDEDSDECPFENVNGSPCEPVATNPCYADHESDECSDYAMDYCENVNPGDPGCDDMGGEELPTEADWLEYFDADGDGVLTLDEIIDGVNEGNLLSGESEMSEDEENHFGIMFNEADVNDDGILEPDPAFEIANLISMIYSDDGGEGDCPFEDVAGSPCEPVATNPCAADDESTDCYDYVMDYCEDVNPDDPGCDDMGDGEHTFICGNGDEIPFEWVNDGEADCPDGADEQQYEADGSEMNWFDCHDGSEIWIHQVNDGTDDCAYGEDESHGTDDGGDDLEIASMDVDIWFEQWDDSSMEFVMVQSMVIDDAETIAAYAMMADMFFGNGDGEVTQNEVDLLVLMMSEDALDDFDMSDIMRLDGNPGMLVDAWMDIFGLVEGDGEVTMVMGQVVVFAATPYADSTTHTFTIDDDDDDSTDDSDPIEDCEIDSIWIHNSDTWSVSSIADSASALSFEYDEYNNAWFTGDCPDDSDVVTFTLEKPDGGELPDDTVDDDWEDMDMNKFPMCAYAYAAMMADGTMEARAGIDTAPESGDYTIDLMDDAQYMIYVVCMDPEGQDMTVTIHNADLNLTSTYTANAEAEASLLLAVPAGYDGTYVFEVTWTDGHHTESGTLTVNGLGDGTGGDLEAAGDGFLPGFTAALGIVALLGAAMISSRRD